MTRALVSVATDSWTDSKAPVIKRHGAGETQGPDAEPRGALAHHRHKDPCWPRTSSDVIRQRPPSANPNIHIVDGDVKLGIALAGLLASAGLASAHYASPEMFMALASLDAPGCILLDVGFPSTAALDFQAQLSQQAAAMPVILMTGYCDIASSVRGMKAGAVDFLIKPFEDNALLTAIDTGLARNAAALDARAKAKDAHERYASLTLREREVLLGVTRGLLNKQIAGALSLTEFTVKVHRGTMIRKMGVRTVPDLVRLAQMIDIETS